MQPEERRLFLRVGIPAFLLFLIGGGLATVGDQPMTPALMVVGFPILAVTFIGWAVVVHRLTNKASQKTLQRSRSPMLQCGALCWSLVRICRPFCFVG